MKVSFTTSPNQKYKLRATFTDGLGNIKKVDFGANGYMDYIQYSTIDEKEADKHRKAYIARHKVNQDWNDYMSKGALSRWILWEKRTIQSAIRNYKKMFDL